MNKALMLIIIWALGISAFAQQRDNVQNSISFHALDIYVDSKDTPLAAYQLKFSIITASAKIVGIEGGEHPAFRDAPVYDPKAMQHDRVIIASFNTASKDELPVGKTRVATIHLQTSGNEPLQCVLKVQTAANPEGAKIRAEATWEEKKIK